MHRYITASALILFKYFFKEEIFFQVTEKSVIAMIGGILLQLRWEIRKTKTSRSENATIIGGISLVGGGGGGFRLSRD